MELKNYKERVKDILKNHESARNNDGTLTALYIYKHCPGLIQEDSDGDWCIKLKQLQNLPPLENLRRSRQIIQNTDGEYPPTDPKVIKARKIKQKNWNDAEIREAKEPRLPYDDK